MKTYTPYQERIRRCFSDTYNYLDTHKHVRTDDDWRRAVDALKLYTDPLTAGLLVAVVKELEREYKESDHEFKTKRREG